MTNEIAANETEIISRTLLPENLRTTVTADLFGAYFPLQLEPAVFSFASQLSDDYSGGYWNFFTLSNGGFFMCPDSAGRFQVCSPNGNESVLLAETLGIAVCLFAYSHLSFGQGDFAQTCAEHFHRLREFAIDHAESVSIFRITD